MYCDNDIDDCSVFWVSDQRKPHEKGLDYALIGHFNQEMALKVTIL